MAGSTFYQVDTGSGTLTSMFTTAEALRADIAWNGAELLAANHDPSLFGCPPPGTYCSESIYHYDLAGVLTETSPNPSGNWGAMTHDDELLFMSSNSQWIAGGNREFLAQSLTFDSTIYIDGVPAPSTTAPNITGLTHFLVPIPAAVWLFGSALGTLGWIRRKSGWPLSVNQQQKPYSAGFLYG